MTRTERGRWNVGIGPLDGLTKASLVAAALMIVGGIAWWFVSHNKKSEEYIGPVDVGRMVRTFRSEIQAVVDDPKADAAKLDAALQRIETEQDKWADRSIDSDIREFETRLRTRLDELRRK
jgi:hypothetical protein